MNVYDFDKTIFHGDSTFKFYFYCIKTQPKIMIWLPFQFVSFLLYVCGFIDKTHFKERFYKFFRTVNDMDGTLQAYWDEKQPLIKDWYLKQQRPDDVVISASPEFLLKPICERLGIRYLMASRVDKLNGTYDGLNCYGVEKVIRFREVFPDAVIDEFYSDSLSDSPLADIATTSFIVQENTLIPWNDYLTKRVGSK